MFRSSVLIAVFAAIPLIFVTQAAVRGATAAPPVALGVSNAAKDNLVPLETRVFGRNRLLAGSAAALRVIVTNHLTQQPVRASVTALLVQQRKNGSEMADGSSTKLFSARTDKFGTVDAQFRTPKVTDGAYDLRLTVDAAIGRDQIDKPIEIAQDTTVLLTADKPIYQPSQVIHMRALALDTATRQPLADESAVFEVEDARGNKVFKQSEDLSRFGVASADFQLADEVNMGEFTLRVVLPDTQTEKKVTVQRYVLPKYKVTITTDKPYYMAGQHVTGLIKAMYTFGKPVGNAKVHTELNVVDIGVSKAAEVDAKTDNNGECKFDLALPTAMIGQPFEQGKAIAEVDATVTDTADQKQESNQSVPVVKDPLLIALVPERQTAVPGIPNRLYIAVARPDGTPVAGAHIGISINGVATSETSADDLGLATFDYTPRATGEPVSTHVHVTDANGDEAGTDIDLQFATGDDGIILRSNKTLAKVGDNLSLDGICTAKTGTVYLDVIRDKQTILTRTENIHDGIAHFAVALSNDMAGTLELHAYKIMPDEDIVRDTRTVIVTPANDLNISVRANQDQYKPGQEATLQFTVQDQKKNPVSAAIAVGIVDESVFALSELQPGLEKVYFTLEKELMEPKYEIHGLTPTRLIMPPPPIGPIRPGPRPMIGHEDDARQLAAAMLLADVPSSSEYDYRVDTFDDRWAALREKVSEEMVAKAKKIQDAIQRYRAQTGASLTTADTLTALVQKQLLSESDIEDHWGHPFKANTYGASTYDGYFSISSAGPDGIWGTNDDITDISFYGVRTMGGPRGGFGFGGGGGGFGERNRVGFQLAMPRAGPFGPVGAFDGIAVADSAVAGNIDAVQKRAAESSGSPVQGAPRVRQFFPETMYWNPALITDSHGHAQVTMTLADSITTWRVSAMASSLEGQLGSSTSPIKVFQKFFVDIDFPVALTQHDAVDVPVAVYNYEATAQDVKLTLSNEPWFSLTGERTQSVHVSAGEVTVVHFPITVNLIGQQSLTVTALGTDMSDAVKRDVDVLPDGKEYDTVINDRLEKIADKTVAIPLAAVDGGSSIWVKLYPGTFSQVVEGLDGILNMPNGCFEQTSSTTYPDVLVLSYLKQNKKVNPEIQMKAEQYINIGYQRLVTFECKSGGFSWFGDEPAHQILTAYGLLEFSDMAKVHDVDPALITRTADWLASKQKPDGTWEETNQGIAEGIINRQTGALRSTAYIAWALAESGHGQTAVSAALSYVKAHADEATDPYTLAVILNFLADVDRDGATTEAVGGKLVGLAKVDGNSAYWISDTQTFTGARSDGADLETTGLAAYGLLKWGRNASFVNKVLTRLVQSKNQFGVWGSTQGTVWSLKALLFASSNAVGGGKGHVDVVANGKTIASIDISPENSDVMRQVNVGHIIPGDYQIHLNYSGDGSLLYQIVGRYYLPWEQVPEPMIGKAPLSISVDYDKKTLVQDDTATVTVTIKNNTAMIAEMPLIDVGVPPGFTVVPDALDAATDAKTIEKYTIAARQIIIYLTKLDPNQVVKLTYQIRAKYPIKAQTPLSKVYPYYNPEQLAVSKPQTIEVTN